MPLLLPCDANVHVHPHVYFISAESCSFDFISTLHPASIICEREIELLFNPNLDTTIVGAGRPKCCQAQVLAQRQRRAPVARRYTVGRPRLLQSLLPRLTLRRGAKAVIQAQALGVSELYLGVQVRIYRMDHSGIRRTFYILQCFCCSCSIM